MMLVTSPYQVNLVIPALPGFHDFIGAWVVETTEGVIVVDPGPTSTIPLLVDFLVQHDYQDVFAILLTHIHIDHAGGTGELLKTFPDAKVVVHPRSHQHLIDPTKLFLGSQRVLGDTLMGEYGPILPVPTASLEDAFAEKWGGLATPGHSPDHVAYIVGDVIFCGEALGNTCPLSSSFYLRPATPPRFIESLYLKSVESLINYDSKLWCFGHFGSCDSTMFVKLGALPILAYQQIQYWIEVVDNCRKSEEEIIKTLLETDPLFEPLQFLPSDVQARELIFIKNSLRGIATRV
jgi:glyoxylase-like metal-dependent hydrolase (beta-lactamase superfamily II)